MISTLENSFGDPKNGTLDFNNATQDSLVTPNTAGNVALTSDSWQVQYISYTPVGDLNATCGIGSGASCPSNAYVTKLVQ